MMHAGCGFFAETRRNLWELYQMATVYGRRPSELVEVDESYLAFQLDRLVLAFGRWVEGRLQEREGGRAVHSLGELLEDASTGSATGASTGSATGGEYRALVGLARKMVVPESGVW